MDVLRAFGLDFGLDFFEATTEPAKRTRKISSLRGFNLCGFSLRGFCAGRLRASGLRGGRFRTCFCHAQAFRCAFRWEGGC